jgi:hypothetical protein
MSVWLQVVLDDLKAMAKTFDDEAKNYDSSAPKFLPTPVDSGDASLNQTMKGALDTLSILHHQMTRDIQLHGEKLSYARDSYERHDTDNRQLFDDMTKGLD